MKNYDLSDILSALEQDGKDSRRRQQITKTIKHLESRRRRKILYFSVAAACIALLILPVVLNLVINRHPSYQHIYIAQQSDTIIKPSPVSPSPTLLAHNKQVKPHSHSLIIEPQINKPDSEVVTAANSIDTFPSPEIDDSQIAESYQQQPIEQEPVDSQSVVTPTQPIVSITQEPDSQTSQPPEKVKKHRRFRLSKPSNMDGTVLAFNLKK